MTHMKHRAWAATDFLSVRLTTREETYIYIYIYICVCVCVCVCVCLCVKQIHWDATETLYWPRDANRTSQSTQFAPFTLPLHLTSGSVFAISINLPEYDAV